MINKDLTICNTTQQQYLPTFLKVKISYPKHSSSLSLIAGFRIPCTLNYHLPFAYGNQFVFMKNVHIFHPLLRDNCKS